jgi:hypothetical protein
MMPGRDGTSATQEAVHAIRVTDPWHENILELEPLLRRVVGGTGPDSDTVDDLVQEALARVTAVEVALAGPRDHEREAVVAHEVEGVDTATLAEARQSTPGAVGVQPIGRGESPFQVRTGQRATFTGRLVPDPPGFAQRVGMVPAEAPPWPHARATTSRSPTPTSPRSPDGAGTAPAGG